MAVDATGTPTSLGIPKFNVNVDAPSGLGFNAAMDSIDALLQSRAGNLALTSATATITLGGDSTIARESAGVVRVNQHLHVNQSVQMDIANLGNALYFGSLLDTNLYRGGVGSLRTDTQLLANMGGLTATQVWLGQNIGSTGQPAITLGGDAVLYRNGPADIKTDGAFEVNKNLFVAQDNTSKLYFGSLNDTSIYRISAGVLATDSVLRVQNATGTIQLGASADTNVYRAAANTLKTDSALQVVGDIALSWQGANYLLQTASNKLVFNGDSTTNLYRSAAGVLKTDGKFIATAPASGVAFQAGVSGSTPANDIGFQVVAGAEANPRMFIEGDGRLYFGAGGVSAVDTNLYRSAANTLKTDGALTVVGALNLGGSGDLALARYGTQGASIQGNTASIFRIGGLSAGAFTGAAGDVGLEIANSSNIPGTPTGGGVLYISAGALKYKGTSGTVTTIAPA